MANVRTGTQALKAALWNAGETARRELGAALFAEGEIILAKSKDLVPVDQGPLRASGHVALPEDIGAAVVVRIGYGGPGAVYAVYQHEGTGPAVGRPAFFPPIQVIAEWLKRKGSDAPPFLVARSIGRRGLQPLKFLERPFREAQTGMEARLAARISKRLEAVGGRR